MRTEQPTPMIGRPQVTVVIPHYNYGQYLPYAVRTALEQPAVDADVVIVDDASTDGSAEVARRLASADPRVRLIEHTTNRRHIATYNDGLAAATGTYVVLLSADDALAPGSLARSISLLEAHRSVGLVYGTVRTFSQSVDGTQFDGAAWRGARMSWTVWRGRDWLERVGRRGRNPISNPEVVMRREILDDIGGYDARFPHSADLYLWLRAAARSDVGRVTGVVQAYYRVHDTNMHAVQFGGLLDDYRAVRDTFEAFYDADGDRIRDVDRLRARTRRALSREAVHRTVLLPADASGESEQALLRYSEETDPTDAYARSVYSAGLRMGLRGPLRAMEDLRWRIRHQRELRFGT
jgi:glycosyltransferase involved in cell wall biosynthesis